MQGCEPSRPPPSFAVSHLLILIVEELLFLYPCFVWGCKGKRFFHSAKSFLKLFTFFFRSWLLPVLKALFFCFELAFSSGERPLLNLCSPLVLPCCCCCKELVW